MAEYLAPGVYVEEFDSGVKAMEGVGTSTAGFIGLAEKGPTKGTPVLITSFAEYQRRFGSYLSPQRYGSSRFLPNAVEHFFTNGGSACYVMRVLPEGSKSATATQGRFLFTAKDPGEWGNRLSIVITAGSKGETPAAGNPLTLSTEPGAESEAHTTELSVLDVVVSHDSMTETYSGCTLNPDSPDYLVTRLQLSQLVTVELVEQSKTNTTESGSSSTSDETGSGSSSTSGSQSGPLASLGGTGDRLTIRLSGGTDGPLPIPATSLTSLYKGNDAIPGQRTGLAAFTELSDVNIMAIPGVTDQDVQAALIAHCETMGNRFAVLDTPQDKVDTTSLAAFRGIYDSSYAAMYAPWIKVFDPLCNQAVFLPPLRRRMRHLCPQRYPARGAQGPGQRGGAGLYRPERQLQHRRAGQAQPHRHQPDPRHSRPGHPGVGRPHLLQRRQLEVRQRAASLPLPGGVHPGQHQLGGLRAQRREPVGQGKGHHHPVPGDPAPQRSPGRFHAGPGLLCQRRGHHHDPGRYPQRAAHL